MEWALDPGWGGNSRDCFRINEWGGGTGDLQHCWIMDGTGMQIFSVEKNLTRGLCLTLPMGEIVGFALFIL